MVIKCLFEVAGLVAAHTNNSLFNVWILIDSLPSILEEILCAYFLHGWYLYLCGLKVA